MNNNSSGHSYLIKIYAVRILHQKWDIMSTRDQHPFPHESGAGWAASMNQFFQLSLVSTKFS